MSPELQGAIATAIGLLSLEFARRLRRRGRDMDAAFKKIRQLQREARRHGWKLPPVPRYRGEPDDEEMTDEG